MSKGEITKRFMLLMDDVFKEYKIKAEFRLMAALIPHKVALAYLDINHPDGLVHAIGENATRIMEEKSVR